MVSVKWFSRRGALLHATALIVVAACLARGWWQLERALSGYILSWVYTFEWPFFAGYAISRGGGSCTRAQRGASVQETAAPALG